MKPTSHDYQRAAELINAIESELKRIRRWSEPLPREAFENMGAFGQNTMTFEQWIQFVLLNRLRSIVSEQKDFPEESNLSPYAIRVFDGDTDTDPLRDLLFQLDKLVNTIYAEPHRIESQPQSASSSSLPQTITLGAEKLPDVVYTLVDVLHQFEGESLESQLQTYDTFLGVCSPTVRPTLHDLLMKAAGRTQNEASRMRIEQAAESILSGGRATDPYNHDVAMKKYQEEHKQNFPDQTKY